MWYQKALIFLILVLALCTSAVLADEDPKNSVGMVSPSSEAAARRFSKPGEPALPDKESIAISNTNIDSKLIDIVWCGEAKEDVMVLTEKGTVYRSDNHGETWKKLRETFAKAARPIVDTDVNIKGLLIGIY